MSCPFKKSRTTARSEPIVTGSEPELEAVGSALANSLSYGDIVFLEGELGATPITRSFQSDYQANAGKLDFLPHANFAQILDPYRICCPHVVPTNDQESEKKDSAVQELTTHA